VRPNRDYLSFILLWFVQNIQQNKGIQVGLEDPKRNEIHGTVQGIQSIIEGIPTLLQSLHSSSPEVFKSFLKTLSSVATTLSNIAEGKDPNVVGYCFVLYRFGFIYPMFVDEMRPNNFYYITRRFLSFGFIRKLSKQEKYHNMILRRVYLKRKGRPSWDSLLGDRNFEKLTAYAPTEPFRDFLTLVFEKLQVRPPEWAVKLVSEYAHILSSSEDLREQAKEAEMMMAIQKLEEMLPEIADTWLKARAYGWNSPHAQKWREYVQMAQQQFGLEPKEFIDIVFSYARKELGINV